PLTFTAFWPWMPDDFTGRLYSAPFLAPAVGAWLLSGGATQIERLTLGLTQLVLGLGPIAGVVSLDVVLHRVNWSSPGPWVWIGLFTLVALMGAGMVWRALAAGRAATPATGATQREMVYG
ncbi:MAG: hypothetical protein ACRDJN_07440, partial [Chloroflexota bacterium]